MALFNKGTNQNGKNPEDTKIELNPNEPLLWKSVSSTFDVSKPGTEAFPVEIQVFKTVTLIKDS